jgi:zinc transport system permease protein
MADFIWHAILAGVSLAVVAGPLGSFVVWRRMSYFGDTLAHSALLGIALGLLLNINIQISILVICMALALVLVSLERKNNIAVDTLLGILAHSTLAIGIVLLALTGTIQVNLEAYLFGELLTISTFDLWIIIIACAGVSFALYYFWNDFLSVTVHEELAFTEGVEVLKMRYLMVALMAVVTAVSMKIVGVLLITSLLIIPPAAARQVAHEPENMAVLASIIGCFSVLCGVAAAFLLNSPVGPSIVVVSLIVFLFLYAWPKKLSG